ncbi:Uncharacterised protein [Vibrio cholerae]|uniref:Uncharacterized protein n=1 Tax=Vibrio cholerae TaxID=666 RepID=A0A655TCA5_VIBCL|nr:Uncharacterised protein [Vibrio cholerae]CSB33847.1 Uncharacterised protein [Vibrio cholerae]CSB73916.1 Uncharacterised protein [Vibrio cholerae]CSB99201.1 Uncharacterised protein [Vibrio cholerae]CSC37349.1 Uncharacterised protein [Vibrio cholerae]
MSLSWICCPKFTVLSSLPITKSSASPTQLSCAATLLLPVTSVGKLKVNSVLTCLVIFTSLLSSPWS